MNEEVREMDVMKQKVMEGMKIISPVLAVLLQGSLKLIQHFIRLHREGKLSKGEIEKYKKFFKATNGQYTIKNVAWTSKWDYESFKEQLNNAKITFSELPRQNDFNHTQIAVYDRDVKKFENLFNDYIEKQLSGGEKASRALRALTKGHSQIISVPIEDENFIEETLKPDLNRLKVNYSVMPDLKVGDGYSQLLVAEKDLYSVKEWFEQYRNNLLKEGKTVDEMRTISKEEYQATANMTEDEYIALNPKHKELSEKYDKDPDLGEALEMQAKKEKATDNLLFKKKYEDPSLTMLSVDKVALVDEPGLQHYLHPYSPEFRCRIPGTNGENICYLSIPKENVFFYSRDGERPRYLCFLDKFEQPNVFDAKGEQLPQFKNSLYVTKHFNDASKQINNANMPNLMKHLQKLDFDAEGRVKNKNIQNLTNFLQNRKVPSVKKGGVVL